MPANLFSRLVEKKITVISQVFNQVFHLVLWCNFKTSKRNSINLLATRWRLISHCKTSNYMYTLNCYNHRLIARLLARRTTFARGCNVSVSKSNFMLTGHLYCTLRLRELTRKTHSTNLLASALEFGLVRAPRRNKTDTLPRVFCPVFAPCHMYVLVCMCTMLIDLDPNDILHTNDAGNRSQIAITFNPTVPGPLLTPLGWYAWIPYPSTVFDTKFRTKQWETCFRPRNSRFEAKKSEKKNKFWPVTCPILPLKINRWAFWKRGQAGAKLSRNEPSSNFLITEIFFSNPLSKNDVVFWIFWLWNNRQGKELRWGWRH